MLKNIIFRLENDTKLLYLGGFNMNTNRKLPTIYQFIDLDEGWKKWSFNIPTDPRIQ